MSRINWETGKPPAYIECLITDKYDRVSVDLSLNTGFKHHYEEDVIAWCPLIDIDPYKKDNCIENRIIYLVLPAKELFHSLSINDRNQIINRYENDHLSVVDVEDDVEDVFITTTLYNVLKNHDIMDLRFIVEGRTKYHKSEINFK
jgi:hypothetical protein